MRSERNLQSLRRSAAADLGVQCGDRQDRAHSSVEFVAANILLE